MKRWHKVVIGVAVVLVGMQAIRFAHTNPPVTGEIQAPAEVAPVLRRGCYDCHSNETVWPWYGEVAPFSWLLHRDVVEGRRHLNFSEWSALPPEKKTRKQHSAFKQVDEGEMPPWFYLPMHSSAHLSQADKDVLRRWSEGPTSP